VVVQAKLSAVRAQGRLPNVEIDRRFKTANAALRQKWDVQCSEAASESQYSRPYAA